MRHVKWPAAFPSREERRQLSPSRTTSPESLRSTRSMVTSSRSRPTTLCAKSAVPGFSRTQPERKSNSSMMDLVGMDRGNHTHGGLSPTHTMWRKGNKVYCQHCKKGEEWQASRPLQRPCSRSLNKQTTLPLVFRPKRPEDAAD